MQAKQPETFLPSKVETVGRPSLGADIHRPLATPRYGHMYVQLWVHGQDIFSIQIQSVVFCSDIHALQRVCWTRQVVIIEINRQFSTKTMSH